MSIVLNYKDLPESMVTPAYLVDATETRNINVKAPLEFVKDLMFPLLRFLASGASMKIRPYAYSSFFAKLSMEPDSEPIPCGMVYLRKSRHYADAFNIFSTYGINLSGIWLMYHKESKTLYIPKKVFQFVCRMDAGVQATYVMMLMYYYRLLMALPLVDNEWQECKIGGESSFQIGSGLLDNLTKIISPECDSEEVNLACIGDDLVFKALVYKQCPRSTDFPLAMATPSLPAEGYCYNVIESKGNRYFVIVNKIFKPGAYYIIDLKKGTICTNSLLQMWNCTSDGAEFVPWLARTCAMAASPGEGMRTFGVASMDIATLFDTAVAGDFSITDDTTGFDGILDAFPMISENSDPDIYAAACTKVKLIKGAVVGNMKSQYDSDKYAQSLYAKNLPYYETFPLGSIANLVKGVTSSGDGQVYSMFFKGGTGTGKSTAARVIFCRAGLPWISINCSTNIDEADIFGCMVPNPEKVSADDPEFVWKDGPATKCIRNGYGLIVEEANGARPGVLLKFNSLLDEARQIELGNGEVLKAHPNFRIVFTANIAYEGTNELNMALVDRFDTIVEFKDMSRTDAINTIQKRTGYADVSKIEKVYGVYEAIKKYSAENNLGLAVSIRRLLCIFTKGKYFKTAKDAVENMLLEHAFIRDEDHKEYFVNDVLPSFDLNFKI
jgi:MoxR-like ATPase